MAIEIAGTRWQKEEGRFATTGKNQVQWYLEANS